MSQQLINTTFTQYVVSLIASGENAVHVSSLTPSQSHVHPQIEPSLLPTNVIYDRQSGWMRSPRYQHDCECCSFKGVVTHYDTTCDVYHCSIDSEHVMRFGDDPQDNISVTQKRLNSYGFGG